MSHPADHFAGSENVDELIDALCGQRIVRGSRAVAAALAAAGEVVRFAAGEELIRQGGNDRDCYFILAGDAEIKVNGRTLDDRRSAGEVVGEFSAINTKLPRTATVTATAPLAALKCSPSALREAGRIDGELWRLLAIDLTHKIEQRNKLIAVTNERPRIFIIAAEERIRIAEALETALSKDCDVDLWSDKDLVPPGGYEIDTLREKAKAADFGIVLAHPDDLRRSKERLSEEQWETLLFELGYLMSELTRHRTLLMIPDGGSDAPPQLFKGMQPMTYTLPTGDMPLRVAIARAVEAVLGIVRDRKVRSRLWSPD